MTPYTSIGWRSLNFFYCSKAAWKKLYEVVAQKSYVATSWNINSMQIFLPLHSYPPTSLLQLQQPHFACKLKYNVVKIVPQNLKNLTFSIISSSRHRSNNISKMACLVWSWIDFELTLPSMMRNKNNKEISLNGN